MDEEKWYAYQEQIRKSMEHSPVRVTPEQAIENQRRLDEIAGRKNPFLGMSYNQVREIKRKRNTGNKNH